MSPKPRFLTVEQVLSNACQSKDDISSESMNEPPARTASEQVGGTHYAEMAIQPIDFIMKNELSFAEGNVVKYVCRYRKKGGKADLLKAKQYIDFLLQQHYPESGK